MGSSVPPERQPSVREFDPAQLDRTVIALPLLIEMKKDLDNIARLKKIDETLLERYTAAIEYNRDYPGGLAAAYAKVNDEQLKLVSDAASVAADKRVKNAPADEKKAETKRRDGLKKSIEFQKIEPP